MAMDLKAKHEQTKDYPHRLGRLIVKTWADPVFKKKAETDPRGALADFGIHVPADVPVDKLPLPPRPADLSDEQLNQANANDGSCAGSAGSASCPSCSAGTAASAH
ncbi:thiocillin family RiPP [Thalassospira marina]|uniref:NHLP leader peptide family natural product n=1 Tax=Thalassospira marina TaxID=2048283 RepID=A0A2N3KQU2_9PROT|nr:thiocillin family RiPP [Thalassospira marina]AUG55580.1 hypothetical protein CSC3H3_22240 [Thalassospira marina]PKR52928.1 hypothetical protein COO20_16660 [Thalassospira marina]